jgi:hypothetical protein
VDLELARQHWQDGNRRVEAARHEARHYRQLVQRVEIVSADLRRRLGQSFTLDELAELYAGADGWVGGLLDDADPDGAPVTEPGTIADAAFFSFARGASDYRP